MRTNERLTGGERVTLRTIAERLQLTPSTISVVLNGRPAAAAIPQHTKERIRQAAHELNYRPNYFARSLSLKTSRTYVVAVLVADIAARETAAVVAEVESILRQRGYLMFVGICERYASERYLAQLAQHGVEGVITLDVQADYFGALPIIELKRDASEVAVRSLVESVESGGKRRIARRKARRKADWGLPESAIPPAGASGSREAGAFPE